ncbi:hypothetical protein HPT27_16500 [Permianibacter sp. IMCC34836]|uniref:hypothetical protein n=1 Tax=Permianibacter fluminis TaxID=2738515 RepID=UPI001557C03B|nr:hypothetical protein [Permianibacter fluminis]NQD38626.1 hypothetical protein [Permianibacter fluminis]
MRRQGKGFHHAACAAFSLVLFGFILAAVLPQTAQAALPAERFDEPDVPELDLNRDRWQRFLSASAARYQALAEKAEMLQGRFADDCAEPTLMLADRRECLRGDVFARAAMERDGMSLDEYASVLHAAVANSGTLRPSASQRGQFQRLRAEWWPERRTAGQ